MKNLKESLLLLEARGPVNEASIEGKVRTLCEHGYQAYTYPETPKKDINGKDMKEWVTFEKEEGIAFFISRVLDNAETYSNRDSKKILNLVSKYRGK